MLHSASVNATDRLRIISNTTAVLKQPLRFSGPGLRTLAGVARRFLALESAAASGREFSRRLRESHRATLRLRLDGCGIWLGVMP